MHGRAPIKEGVAAKPSMTRRAATWSLVLLVIAGAGYYFFAGTTDQAQRGGRGRGGGEGPVPVLAVAAKRADVPVYLDAVGTARALNIVTVRPQVEGKLLTVNFQEGQDVKKGDVLAQIDPTTFKAALDQAVAKKAQDEAQLANTRNDLARYERLAATNAINQQQADTQKALVAQNEALVQGDQAAIDNARATLAYTTITAPIEGRTGIRQVDAGNIVRTSDANGIVVITQITPISVLFNLPQQDLDRVNTAFAKGPLAAEALRSDNDQVISRGTLTVVDNQVDQATGTVRLKAEFANTGRELWPGQFVNVRLLVDTLKDVIVIPTGAVQRGPKGTFVYIVKDDSSVAVQPINVQRQDEDQSVVASGLEPPQRVITSGFARLSEGTKVTATAPGETPAPAPTQQRRRNRAQGQTGGSR
ncbi:MAG TPA: efflux RND transporter periplasmic adaptor subunit [Reyranella sp.]|nr:efflux RND transporter periplasmic adaptor subunit [Reyranella sp.]